jgi:hypothetical protein
MARLVGRMITKFLVAFSGARREILDLCPTERTDIPDYNIGLGRTLRSIQRVDLFGKHAKGGATRLVTVILRILGQGQTP